MSKKPVRLPATIIDQVFGQNFVSSVTFIVAGAALTAILAQFVVPLDPVPLTAQTLAVLLVGMALGALRGALAMVVYVGLGAIGLPIFSGGEAGITVLTGPTGGYLIGYVFCAAIAGLFAERQWDRTFIRALAGASVAIAVTFICGLIGLAVAFHARGQSTSISSLIEVGLTPFLLGAATKIILAAAILSVTWSAVLRHSAVEPISR